MMPPTLTWAGQCALEPRASFERPQQSNAS
jgi:hypothetical protein